MNVNAQSSDTSLSDKEIVSSSEGIYAKWGGSREIKEGCLSSCDLIRLFEGLLGD